jgi:AcrR family transcriptional regulator
VPELAQATSTRVNAPKQARSQETLDRFLDAVEALLLERDFADITVADIVARADRTVGSFYARFVDKDAVLLACAQRSWSRDRLLLREFLRPDRWVDRPIDAWLRAGLGRMVDTYRNPRPTLKATVLMGAADAEFAAHRRDMFDELHQLCQQVAHVKRDEIDHPVPERAVEIGFRHAAAVCDHLVLFGSYWQADDVPDHVIVEDLVDFQMRVFRDGAPRPD